MNDEVLRSRHPMTTHFLKRLAAVIAGVPEPEEHSRRAPFYLFVYYEGKEPEIVEGKEGPEVTRDASQLQALIQTLSARSGKAVEWIGPFVSPYQVRTPFVLRSEVAAFTRRIRTDNEDTDQEFLRDEKCTFDLTAHQLDMLCWTPAAFDKFVAPYYYELWGANPTAALKVQKLKRDVFVTGSGMMGHRWPTISVGLKETLEDWVVLKDQVG